MPEQENGENDNIYEKDEEDEKDDKDEDSKKEDAKANIMNLLNQKIGQNFSKLRDKFGPKKANSDDMEMALGEGMLQGKSAVEGGDKTIAA